MTILTDEEWDNLVNLGKLDFEEILAAGKEQEYFDLLKKAKAENNYDLLSDIEAEAFDRLWLDRSSIGTKYEPKNIPEDIRQQALEAQKRVIEEYNITADDCGEYYHGYWSGILALSRFLSGAILQADLDNIRTGDELLDT